MFFPIHIPNKLERQLRRHANLGENASFGEILRKLEIEVKDKDILEKTENILKSKRADGYIINVSPEGLDRLSKLIEMCQNDVEDANQAGQQTYEEDLEKNIETNTELLKAKTLKELLEEESSEEESSEDKLSEDELFEDKLLEEELLEDELSEEDVNQVGLQTPVEDLEKNKETEKELSEDELSEDELSEDELSEDELSEDELSEGELSEGELSEEELLKLEELLKVEEKLLNHAINNILKLSSELEKKYFKKKHYLDRYYPSPKIDRVEDLEKLAQALKAALMGADLLDWKKLIVAAQKNEKLVKNHQIENLLKNIIHNRSDWYVDDHPPLPKDQVTIKKKF